MAKAKVEIRPAPAGAGHNRLHVITSPLDHTSGATPGQVLQADANGLPVDATNSDAQVAATVGLAHAQGTDIALGVVGTKNPPIDADKSLYRDSAAGDALVTSTWTQVKAFLKTYFDTLYGALALAHNRLHSITSALDHTSGATPGQILKADANGLPIDAANSDLQVAATVALAHARQHAITNALDHTSAATPGKILKADANGLPVDATNTDADVADAVSKKHTQGTDTALGAVGTKNPPIDADKVLQRDSAAADALVTSTWAQIKAFLKTYFDTLYAAIGLAHARLHSITSALDHSSAATPGKILKADANGLPVDATNTDAEVADAVTKRHTQGTDVALGAVGVKNPPIDADKVLYRDSAAADVLVTSTWAQIKAFLKTYFDGLYAALIHSPRHDYLGADELSVVRLISQRAISFNYKSWEDINGFTAAHTGSGAFTTGWMYGVLDTGVTNNSVACIYSTLGTQIYPSIYGTSWGMRIFIGQGTTQTIWLGMLVTPATPSLTQGHIAFYVDTSKNLWASSGDGVHGTQTDTGIDITIAQAKYFSIYLNSVGIYYYVDHVLKATHLLAGSYYPDTLTCKWVMYLKNATDGATRTLYPQSVSMFPTFAY
jgi:hypothetical protein